MKKLTVTINLELEIPDEWELRKTSEGIDVVKIGENQYLDMTFEPMLTHDLEGTWTDSADDAFLNELLDMVASESVSYHLETVH
jgi:hypothetical protein